jgi:isoleucyl-tRNA synthetase
VAGRGPVGSRLDGRCPQLPDGLVPMSSQQPYPDVPSRADYPAIEERILARWAAEDTFERSVDQRPRDDAYVFYDGPPFANGLPHYGHILTGYVKDVIPRYRTMRGERVERRFGWDCHGLPAEMVTEKELDVSGRKAIEEFGIDRFNDACRASVLQYTDEWEQYVTRMGRWVDFDDDYKTMDLSYMESVIWAFKQLWDKGLVYEDARVMPYSWGAQTPLSNFEIRMDDATRPRQDPAVTVAFELDEPITVAGRDDLPTSILIWTTTPWTLPSNLAVAVGPDVEYALVEHEDGHRYLLGKDALGSYEREFGEEPDVVATFPGRELEGLGYRPPFDFFVGHANSHRVLLADFVETGDGTGVVHMAPGFGEEDYDVCTAAGIELVVPVDDAGAFTDEVPAYAGMNVFDANPVITDDLKASGALVRHDTYEHNYPHCWRTDTPIIYKAIPSWYVEVTRFRDRMVELNQQINWIPDHVQQGAFGKWLEGARDWSISRNRFWGSPIPVWKSDDPAYPRVDVYGSIAELERDFGVEIDDLHRPFIDDLVRPNPDDPTGESMMRRVPEVLDCWFESGSMPFAQLHYPFEHKEQFEDHFPADFIVEYIGQTSGWFYTLHVLATAIFDQPAFENVICHGIVLDSEGRKLSKRLRNYPEPLEMFEQVGSDAMRWFLVASPVLRGENLRVEEDGSQIVEQIRVVLNPIWSAFYFFTLYANADGIHGRVRTDSDHLLDRYVLAKTRILIEQVEASLDAYELSDAADAVLDFLEALNNWYIRRSRDRFWSPATAANDDTKHDAYDTLYTVLVTMSKVLAPLLPFLTEEIHGVLTGGGSVHLEDWPDASDFPDDEDLAANMDRARDVVTAALNLREDAGLRARLPLASLTVAGRGVEGLSQGLLDLVADEVNVKRVEVREDVGDLGTFRLKPNGRAIGPKLGPDTQQVIKAANAGDWEVHEDGTATVSTWTLEPGDFELALHPAEGVTARALRTNDAVVSIDTEVTPALEAEGLARDLVRAVQQARRDAGLDVSDRIRLTLHADQQLHDRLRPHQDYVADQVLATAVDWSPTPQETPAELAGATMSVHVERA